jgi:hypothetical protein
MAVVPGVLLFIVYNFLGRAEGERDSLGDTIAIYSTGKIRLNSVVPHTA